MTEMSDPAQADILDVKTMLSSWNCILWARRGGDEEQAFLMDAKHCRELAEEGLRVYSNYCQSLHESPQTEI